MAFGSGTESLVFIDDNDMATLCSDSAVAVKLITLNFTVEMESILRKQPKAKRLHILQW